MNFSSTTRNQLLSRQEKGYPIQIPKSNPILEERINSDQLISSNRNLEDNSFVPEIDQSQFRRTSRLIQQKNNETNQILQQHTQHLQNKKEKLKKYYDDYIMQLNEEQSNLILLNKQMQTQVREQVILEEKYTSLQIELESFKSRKNDQALVESLKKLLSELQHEKLQLVNMLELEKEKLVDMT